jgi:hypothetical protein
VTRGARQGYVVLCAALLSTACGGGAPLLHAAHTLGEGDVAFAAGTSGQLSVGELEKADSRLDATAGIPGGATSEGQRRDFVRGGLTRLAVAPGVAPFAAARVGLGRHNEAGLTYTGRSFRLDGRHALEWPSVALSFGGSATGVLARPGNEPDLHVGDMPRAGGGLRTLELTSVSGYGLELPLLFGYRSSADVVKLWTGLRAGFEHDSANLTLVAAPDTALASTGSATRFWGGGLVGFSVGLSPIEVRVELDAAYQTIHGNVLTEEGELSGSIAGWSLTPAMAISAKL